MVFQKRINGFLDQAACPYIHVFGRLRSAFRVCGCTGLVLTVALTMTLVVQQGLSLWVLAGLIVSSVATFLMLVMITKILVGEEQIVYYHHEIAVLSVAALLLWVLGQPVLRYLEVTQLGVGIFLASGRVGCLMVGCCHGVPHRWGVCYRPEHAEAGFTRHYVGVRLFPIQIVESLYVLGVVIVGTVFVWSGRPPGEALAWYVVTYDIGRFFFEFVRGDPDRPYYGGFSEAQWISLFLMIGVVGAEWYGVLPFHLWHVVAMAGVAFTMLAVVVRRRLRRTPLHQLLNPHHVQEVAGAIDLLSRQAKEAPPVPAGRPGAEVISVACTSLGVRISGGRFPDTAASTIHYTLSSETEPMAETTARTLAGLIVQLKHPLASNELVTGNLGVFHLIIDQS